MAGKAPVKDQKGYKGLPMEGAIARWYDRFCGTPHALQGYADQARRLTAELQDGADVLEVAPGPGYHAIELARLGAHVRALEISRSFVSIGTENVRRADVRVEFQQGDASRMPYDDDMFDLIVCQAAFKNFSRPIDALDEMHRVLRPGATAVIQDMSGLASGAAIDDKVRGMGLSRTNAFMTRRTLRGLRRSAYSPERFEQLAAESAFGGCTIRPEGIELEVRLTKVA